MCRIFLLRSDVLTSKFCKLFTYSGVALQITHNWLDVHPGRHKDEYNEPWFESSSTRLGSWRWNWLVFFFQFSGRDVRVPLKVKIALGGVDKWTSQVDNFFIAPCIVTLAVILCGIVWLYVELKSTSSTQKRGVNIFFSSNVIMSNIYPWFWWWLRKKEILPHFEIEV